VARYVELRRHTDSDGDPLTEEGVRAALEIGRRLTGPYALLVSSGAQRATQTLACFACALADTAGGGVIVEAALRSDLEDRWRAAYRRAFNALRGGGGGGRGAAAAQSERFVDRSTRPLSMPALDCLGNPGAPCG
jgi:broad specificity phosphatase PhoE